MKTTGFKSMLQPKLLNGTRMRSRVEQAIRNFFLQQNFLETKTPLFVKSPGMEPHIHPFQVIRWGEDSKNVKQPVFLPTSPEFAMKKLLVAGLKDIFQICPAFRSEPDSPAHRPEFTMLEWYRADVGYEKIMDDVEQLFSFLAAELLGKQVVTYDNRCISLERPWPRFQVNELFKKYAHVDLIKAGTIEEISKECNRFGIKINVGESWDDLYFKIWLNIIEPQLPADRPIIVYGYPSSQAALSVVDQFQDGHAWAKRFEVYAGGLELGNAFQELTDPIEQRKRFVEDMDLREKVYGDSLPKSPIDESFIKALEEGMPQSSGIAMGVDRIVMLFANETDIGNTLFFS